jgi:hypothetical protein
MYVFKFIDTVANAIQTCENNWTQKVRIPIREVEEM